MSYKPQVKIDGEWVQNGQVFASEEEALKSANRTFMNLLTCDNCRAIESDQPVNSRYDGENIVSVP